MLGVLFDAEYFDILIQNIYFANGYCLFISTYNIMVLVNCAVYVNRKNQGI